MIRFISGPVRGLSAGAVVIEVGGLGILVWVTDTAGLSVGATVKLATHLMVREDELKLYGFKLADELALFEALISVPGIGPGKAYTLLSKNPWRTVLEYIVAGDTRRLAGCQGIGAKVADTVVRELSGKLSKFGLKADEPTEAPLDDAEQKLLADLKSALVGMGYKAGEAERAAHKTLSKGPKKTLAELIPVALRHAARRD